MARHNNTNVGVGFSVKCEICNDKKGIDLTFTATIGVITIIE